MVESAVSRNMTDQENLNADITKSSGFCAHPAKVPPDMSKAKAFTAHAINHLGAPIYASMTDYQPVDKSLVQAKTQLAIKKGGQHSLNVAKRPVDRALLEVQTLAKLNTGKITSVPEEKDPDGHISLAHAKTLLAIDGMKGRPIFASCKDHQPSDIPLIQAKTLVTIKHRRQSSANPDHVPVDRVMNQAKTMRAIEGKAVHLKKVSPPKEGLSPEELAELLEQSKLEEWDYVEHSHSM